MFQFGHLLCFIDSQLVLSIRFLLKSRKSHLILEKNIVGNWLKLAVTRKNSPLSLLFLSNFRGRERARGRERREEDEEIVEMERKRKEKRDEEFLCDFSLNFDCEKTRKSFPIPAGFF